ncbi:MAG: hypothetical protein IMZ61_14680 [Planctomycetes bacterium]|nr:hypothetical protein [Planctomycetota bacterium]
MKRVLAMSDPHCGHAVGLSPPEWQYQATGDKYHDKHARIQKQMWEWFTAAVERNKPVDRLIINGDAIDGKGQKSGGTEQFEMDRHRQGLIVDRIAEEIAPESIAMTFGTGYHVGTDEDFETPIADRLGATIESHLEREVEGVRIDAKHFIGSSSIPHGRYTALAREDLWRLIWADRSEKFAPHIVIRSHVHYFGFCGNEWATMFTLPSLQGLGSKFGSRICSGTVSIGFLIIDCEDGKYTWKPEILPLKEQVSAWKPW